MTIGIAPEGMQPIDLIFINELTRQYLWTQDSLRLSIMALFDSLAFPNFPMAQCCFAAMAGNVVEHAKAVAQGLIDRAMNIIYVDSEHGLDYFSAFPLFLSARLKGGATTQSQLNLGKYLLDRFIHATQNFKVNYYNRNSWMKRILDKAEVKESSHKFVYLLASKLIHVVDNHHQEQSEALAAITLSACCVLIEMGLETQATVLLNEVGKLKREKKISAVTSNYLFGLEGTPESYPDFSWVQANLDKLLGAFGTHEECKKVVRLLRIVYHEHLSVLDQLEVALGTSESGEFNPSAVAKIMLFKVLNPQQVVADYKLWEEQRTGLEKEKQLDLDRECFGRVVAFRPDIAAEILNAMAGQLSVNEIDPLLIRVMEESLKKEDALRSWPRLKRLLKKVEEKAAKTPLSTRCNELMMALVEEAMKSSNCDEDFVECTFKMTDPQQRKPEILVSFADQCMEGKDVAGALKVWSFGEQLKLWKQPLGGAPRNLAVKLALSLDFSLQYSQFYKQLDKVNPSECESSTPLVEGFFTALKKYNGTWTTEQANLLIAFLRTPLFLEYMRRNKDPQLFELLYAKIVNKQTLDKGRISPIVIKESMDYVDAILCVGVIRGVAEEDVKKRAMENLGPVVIALHQAYFNKEAVELLTLGMHEKKVAFIKPQDGGIVKELIVEAKDVLLFAQYRNLLEKVEGQQFASLETQVIGWMEGASPSSWEILFPENKQVLNEALTKTLWGYLCKVLMGGKAIDEAIEKATIRAISSISTITRKKLFDMFDIVEQMTQIHGTNTKDRLLRIFVELFTRAIAEQHHLPKEFLDKIWFARMILHNQLGIEFGVGKAWNAIDVKLAILSSAHPDFVHHEMSSSLLVRCTPSAEISLAISKFMDRPGNKIGNNIVEYLRKCTGAVSDVSDIVKHKNAGNLFLNISKSAFEVLDPIRKKALEEHDINTYFAAISIAVQIATQSEGVKLAYANELIAIIVSLQTSVSKTRFIECVLNYTSLEASINDDDGSLGLLLLHALRLTIELNSPKLAEALLSKIVAFATQKPLFKAPAAQAQVEIILQKFDATWNPLLNTLMNIVKDSAKCQSYVVLRMKTLIEMNDTRDKANNDKERLALLLQHAPLLKKHQGKKVFRDLLCAVIESCGSALLPEIERLFDESLAFGDIPEAVWKKLFVVLKSRNDESIMQSIAERCIRYTLAHFGTAETTASAFDVFHLTLLHLSKHLKQNLLELLTHQQFLDALCLEDKGSLTKRMQSCRLFLRSTLVALSDQSESTQKERWMQVVMNAQDFLDRAYPEQAGLTEKAKEEYLEEAQLYQAFLLYLYYGRWENDDAFDESCVDPTEMLSRMERSQFVQILNEHLRFLCDHLPTDRRKKVLGKFMDALPNCSKVSLHEDVKSAVQGVMRYYIKEHTVHELLMRSSLDVALSRTAYAAIFLEVMSSLYADNFFDKHETAYYAFITSAAMRRESIPYDTLLNALRNISKKSPGQAKTVACAYFTYVNAYLKVDVKASKFSKVLLPKIVDFIGYLERHMLEHYTSAFDETDVPSSSGPQSPLKFDDSFVELAGFLYLWVNCMQIDVYKSSQKDGLQSLTRIVKKVAGKDRALFNLIMVKIKLELLKRTENFPAYARSYREIIAEMKGILPLLNSETAVNIYLPILEEVCFLDPLERTAVNTLSKVTAVDFDYSVTTVGSREVAMYEWSQFTQSAFDHPLIKAKIGSDKDLVSLKILASHSSVNNPCGEINIDDIWVVYRRISTLLEAKLPVCTDLALDLLVPSALVFKSDATLEKTKRNALWNRPKEYIDLWKKLLFGMPDNLQPLTIVLAFCAIGRLAERPGAVPKEMWNNMVYEIVTEGLLHAPWRTKGRKTESAEREAVLMKALLDAGTFDDKMDEFYNAFIADAAMHAVNSWKDIHDKPGFQTNLKTIISLLDQKKWNPKTIEHREESFVRLLKGILKIKENKKYVESLLECWNGLVASGCFSMSLADLKRKISS